MTDMAIILPAFLAGLLVLASHVPLGREVLKRGIIFIDLAVAQAAATGAILASELWHQESVLIVQLAAGSMALLVAAFLHELEKRCPRVQEPIIGCTFVVLACMGMLLVAADPHGGEHFSSLLSGDILWSNGHTLVMLAIASLLSLSFMKLFSHPLPGFYLPFAIAITASVQAVGVYLVFASLILPSIVVWQLPGWRGVVAGFAIGALGYCAGLLASLGWDLPTGPAIVVSLALAAILAAASRYACNVITRRRQA